MAVHLLTPRSVAHPGIRSAFTSYYLPATILPSSGSAAVAADKAYYLPFCAPGAVIDRIGVEITTGVAGLARLGLYTNSNGMPDKLIVDAGAIDTSAAAIVEASITALEIPNAWVWAVIIANATPTLRQGTPNSNGNILGIVNYTSSARGLEAASTYGALPASAVAPTTQSTGAPIISLRKS